MTIKQYHQHLLNLAKENLKNAIRNHKEISENSHSDREMDEALYQINDAQSVVDFLNDNIPSVS